MSINISYFSRNAASHFPETVFSFLSSQQKRIFIIVSIALGLLAISYCMISHGSFRGWLSHPEGEMRMSNPLLIPHREKASPRMAQPILISDDWGEIILEVNGEEKKFKDVVILPSDAKGQQIALEWNWKWQINDRGEHFGMSHHPGIRIIDVEHYVLSREDIETPDVIILSQGRGHGGQRENPGPGILQVEPDVEDYLKERGFEVYILKTAAALEKYEQLIKEGKKRVAALIHSTC